MKLPFSTSALRSYLSYGTQLRPARDWYALVALILMGILISAAWNTWIFVRVTNGEVIGSATSTPAFSPASSASIDSLFSKRADMQAHYQSDFQFVDPARPAS